MSEAPSVLTGAIIGIVLGNALLVLFAWARGWLR